MAIDSVGESLLFVEDFMENLIIEYLQPVAGSSSTS